MRPAHNVESRTWSDRCAEPPTGTGAATVAVLCLLATLVIAWPVVRHPSTQMFGTETVGRHHDPFTVMWQFATGPPKPPYRQPLVDDVGRGLARAIGPVAAFNALVLITFPLSAAAAYALGRYLGLPHVPSIVAALAFAFAPTRIAHAAYHPHIAQTQWIPVYLAALWACTDRPAAARGALLVASAAALALSNLYGAFIAAVVTPIALVLYGVVSPRHGTRPLAARLASLAAPVGVLAAVGGGAVALIAWRAPAILFEPGQFAFASSDLARDGARWPAYFLPPVEHPILGPLALRFWSGTELRDALLEQQLSLGWALLALAGAAALFWARSVTAPPAGQSARAVRAVPVLLGVALWSAFCSLAPADAGYAPAGWLYEAAPMFRAYARFGIVTQLMVALLAGVGLMCLLQARASLAAGCRSNRRVLTVAVHGLLLFAAFESAPLPWRARDVLPTRAHRWLAGQPLPIRALDCVPRDPALALVPWLMAREVHALSPAVPQCDDAALAEQLAALDFTHVIVRRDAGSSPPGDRERPPAPAGLTLVGSFGDADLFAVTSRSAPIVVFHDAGFYPAERGEGRTWRWMAQRGAWMLRNTTGRELPVVAELELSAFAGPRRLALSLDGRPLGVLRVPAQRTRHRVPLRLAPGDSTIALEAIEPAGVADAVERNGDRRTLTVAVSDRRWLAPVDLLEARGFYERESDGPRTWQWMRERATWTVRAAAGANTVVADVELGAFGRPRRLRVSLDGRLVETVAIEPTPRRYRLGPFALEHGEHRITFEVLEPAVVPADVQRSADRRALAVMFADARWEVAPVDRGRS